MNLFQFVTYKPSEHITVWSSPRENCPTDTNKVLHFNWLFVSKNLSTVFIDVAGEFDLDSDHLPTVFTLSDTTKKGRNLTFSNNLTDWDTFQEALVRRINVLVALTTTDELEDEVQKFVTDIQLSAWGGDTLDNYKSQG